jgi:hypothetical protein
MMKTAEDKAIGFMDDMCGPSAGSVILATEDEMSANAHVAALCGEANETINIETTGKVQLGIGFTGIPIVIPDASVPSESAVPAMPERWDSPTSNPMTYIEEGMRLVRGQLDRPEVITPETARVMTAALNDVVAQIDAGRFHDPAVDCRHAEKEECDECNDCGAVLPSIPQLPPLPEIPEKFRDAANAMKYLTADKSEDKCANCEKLHMAAVTSEVQLRHKAEVMRQRDEAWAERDSAILERDARVLDEQMRAQRVDIEALRHKVREMKKNLATVDSRADERFVAQLRARDAEAEARIAAIRAEVQPTIDKLDKVRTGEQARVEALNAALEMIWAFDKREPGCAYNSQNLIVNLRQVLSAARKHAQ